MFPPPGEFLDGGELISSKNPPGETFRPETLFRGTGKKKNASFYNISEKSITLTNFRLQCRNSRLYKKHKNWEIN